MKYGFASLLLVSAAVQLAGCASEPQTPAAVGAAPESAQHEYRTGSLIASHDKHITTPEERKAAEDAAQSIRSNPSFGKSGN